MSKPTVTATSLTSSTIGPSPASRSAAFAVSVKLRKSASAVRAADPMANPLAIAAVVLPSESSASVSRRPRKEAIWAIPPALSAIGP